MVDAVTFKLPNRNLVLSSGYPLKLRLGLSDYLSFRGFIRYSCRFDSGQRPHKDPFNMALSFNGRTCTLRAKTTILPLVADILYIIVDCTSLIS